MSTAHMVFTEQNAEEGNESLLVGRAAGLVGE
jgi:hypothetical protein